MTCLQIVVDVNWWHKPYYVSISRHAVGEIGQGHHDLFTESGRCKLVTQTLLCEYQQTCCRGDWSGTSWPVCAQTAQDLHTASPRSRHPETTKTNRNTWWHKLTERTQFLFYTIKNRIKEGNLFNNALNTFYLRLYGAIHMVKDNSDFEGGTHCRHMGYSFRLAGRVLLYASSHRQDDIYHSLCYTSRGALVGTRNSSMGPPHEGSTQRPIAPWANALTTELHLAPKSRIKRW